MEIESKLDEDRIEIIRKEPEVGDLVAYNRLWDKQELCYTKELGIVKEVHENGYEGNVASVYWLTTQDEEEFQTTQLLNLRLKEDN